MLTDIGGTPVIQSGGGNDNMLGMVLILALLGGGLGNFGGNRNNDGISNEALNTNTQMGFANMIADTNYSNLVAGQKSIERDILTQTDVLTSALASGFGNVNNNLTQVGYQVLGGQKDIQYSTQAGFASLASELASCCCNTQRAIDSVNFNMAKGFGDANFINQANTNAIIQNATANTQRILDFMTCNELKEAQTKISEQATLLSEARIIASMKPQAPIPAYAVPSPYGQYGNTCC